MWDSDRKLSRQELYDRIKETSKDEYILAEMIRLGFWPSANGQPNLAESLIKEREALIRELKALGKEQALYDDPEKALRTLHKHRKEEALKQRELTRQKRNRERFEKALAWYKKQQTEISYIGEGVSYGLIRGVISLEDQGSQRARLSSQKLPEFENALSLATAMGVSLSELRFLAYQKNVSKISHYQQFDVAKKTGGLRRISAPMPRLKRIQYWILDNILNKVDVSEMAHGFVKGRGILSNASPHVGKKVVINLDMENFFPTINYSRVKGLYQKLGYNEQLATMLSLVTTESPTDCYELDEQTWYVKSGERVLPQGAPTSPAISNIICRRLDKRLNIMAKNLGFTYTRYADDVSFSSDTASDKQVNQLLWRCRSIIGDEGFKVHPKKTRIMRQHQRQEVTGLVVNDQLGVDRKTLKKFRALLFQIEKDGPDGKTWGQGELFHSIRGYANYVTMVNPQKGLPLKQKVSALVAQYGQPTHPTNNIVAISHHQRAVGEHWSLKHFRASSAAGRAPRDPWWRVTERPLPVLELTPQQIKDQNKEADDSEGRDSDERNRNKLGNRAIGVGNLSGLAYNSYYKTDGGDAERRTESVMNSLTRPEEIDEAVVPGAVEGKGTLSVLQWLKRLRIPLMVMTVLMLALKWMSD